MNPSKKATTLPNRIECLILLWTNLMLLRECWEDTEKNIKCGKSREVL